MADRSHLTPTSIVDANGRRTTVYRKAAGGPTARHQTESRAIPRTAIRTPEAEHVETPVSETHDEALQRIAARNAQFRRGGLRSTPEARAAGEHAAAAFAARFKEPSAVHLAEDIEWARERIDEAIAECEYAQVALGIQLAPLYAAAVNEACGWEDPADPTAYHPTRAYAVMGVVKSLQEIDLLEHAALPNPDGMRRLAAQVRADGLTTFNYVRRSLEDINACMRLIDARPEHVEEISRLFKDGLHPAEITALLDGEVPTALVSGAL